MVGFCFFCYFKFAHRVSNLFGSELLPITLHISLAASVCSSLVCNSSFTKSSMVHPTLAFSVVSGTLRNDEQVQGRLSNMFLGTGVLCVANSDD